LAGLTFRQAYFKPGSIFEKKIWFESRLKSTGTAAVGGFLLPRDVFKAAILSNAHAIRLGHNHPTGEPAPSIDDLDITRELIQAGEYLKMPVLDHITIGHDDKFVSMLRDELLDFPKQGARKTHENAVPSPDSET
jgi:hypothetical protein